MSPAPDPALGGPAAPGTLSGAAAITGPSPTLGLNSELCGENFTEIEEKRRDIRSARLNKVKENQLTRKKMNEMRLIYAKSKRDEEKKKQFTNKFRLAPIKEDKEGEEGPGHQERILVSSPPGPPPVSRRSSVAPIVIRNRIQQRLTRESGGLYLKAIQELLEIGDAIRVSRSRERIGSVDSEEDGDSEDSSDVNKDTLHMFQHRLRQRKMSLSGVLEQSAAERSGFATLLINKLNQLLIEDDIEGEASDENIVGRRRVSAPPQLRIAEGGKTVC